MTPPTRDRSPLCSSQLTSDARRRPRPTSTSAPTTERTIWWQNDVGLDVEAEQPGLGAELAAAERDLGEAGVEHPPTDGRARRGARDAPAEGPEVVLAQQGVRRARHGPEVEGARHVPRHRGQERVRGLVLEDEVPVAPGPGRTTGVEPGRSDLGGAHHDGGLEQGVHRPDQPGEVHVLAHVDVHHLAPGVHAGVGAPRADELDTVADDHGDGIAPGPPPRCAGRAAAAKPRNPAPS